MCAAGSTFVVQTKKRHITLKPSSLVTLLGLNKNIQKKKRFQKKKNKEIPQVMCAFPQTKKVETPSGVSQRCFELLFFPPTWLVKGGGFIQDPNFKVPNLMWLLAEDGHDLDGGCFAAAAPSGEVARDLWVPTTNNK